MLISSHVRWRWDVRRADGRRGSNCPVSGHDAAKAGRGSMTPAPGIQGTDRGSPVLGRGRTVPGSGDLASGQGTPVRKNGLLTPKMGRRGAGESVALKVHQVHDHDELTYLVGTGWQCQ